jgi:hypothetical protein
MTDTATDELPVPLPDLEHTAPTPTEEFDLDEDHIVRSVN